VLQFDSKGFPLSISNARYEALPRHLGNPVSQMSQVKSSPHKPVRSNVVTQEKIDKRIAAGDGQGVREEYVPWIKVRAFASRGTSHIVPGVKVHRVHHLLSNAEYHYHVILEHGRSIIDIREQFPLLPAAETHAIASSLNVRPPVYPGTSTPLVLTTDFLITQMDSAGKERLVARSMKYAKEIEDASKAEQDRLFEKLEIERQSDLSWASCPHKPTCCPDGYEVGGRVPSRYIQGATSSIYWHKAIFGAEAPCAGQYR